MIQFNEFELDNGLRVLVHEDPNTPMAAVNLLYNVGSKDEHIASTGFAHLFEHFMFEGSKNIPHFDSELQKAGGDNNAFTTSDLTNYYETLPAQNLETAFWLESDRMLELDFNQKSLDTQISVVCEEFKENYINKPYGDIWHMLSDMAYTVHPYKWPTIGLKLEHIQAFTLQDTKDFFYKYYRPNNAILSISGGVTTSEVERLANKWFGNIPRGPEIYRNYAPEPEQTEKRTKHHYANVPVDALYMAFPICDRLHPDYYPTDLLSDIIGTGDSSRLVKQLVKDQPIFSEISGYISGNDEPGLLVIEGKVLPTIPLEAAEEAVFEVLQQIQEKGVDAHELEKVVNKTINYMAFSNESNVNKSFNLAYFKMLNKLEWVNEERAAYAKVRSSDILRMARKIFKPERCSTLYYHANDK